MSGVKGEQDKEALDVPCPVTISAMREMSYVCALQYGSHKPHGAVKHWKCGQYDCRTDFLILFYSY